jgi:hypothetical protein
MKKIVFISTLFLLILCIVTLTGCIRVFQNKLVIVNEAPLEEELPDNFNAMISDYVLENIALKPEKGKIFEAHEIYGIEKEKGRYHIYLRSLYIEHFLENGEVKDELKGSNIPMAMVMENIEGKFAITSHKSAIEQNETTFYTNWEVFPKKYRDIAQNSREIEHLLMAAKIQAEAYFKNQAVSRLTKEGDAAELGFVDKEGTRTALIKSEQNKLDYQKLSKEIFLYMGNNLEQISPLKVFEYNDYMGSEIIELHFEPGFNVTKYLSFTKEHHPFSCSKIMVPLNTSKEIWLLNQDQEGHVYKINNSMDLQYIQKLIDILKSSSKL